jgi:hypothetical protein
VEQTEGRDIGGETYSTRDERNQTEGNRHRRGKADVIRQRGETEGRDTGGETSEISREATEGKGQRGGDRGEINRR